MLGLNKGKNDIKKRGLSPDEGQTYIEVIIATGIISLALLALVSLGFSGFKLTGLSAKKLVAYNLASEGIEICEAIRMDQWLDENNDWPYGLLNDSWVLDYDSTSTVVAAENTDLSICDNCFLCKQADESFKSCSDSSVIYKRMVTITEVEANKEKKAVSEVLYREKDKWRSVKLEARLLNWRQ